jgi:hypothetical protein
VDLESNNTLMQLQPLVRYEELKLNSMVSVRERTIPTKRPPLVGELIANFLRIDGATWSA